MLRAMGLRAIPLVMVALTTLSCGGKKERSRPKDGTPAGDPYEWQAATGPGAITAAAGPAGVVSGKVAYEGAPPAAQVDRASAGCGGAAPDPALRVIDGALQGAVVFIAGAAGEAPPADVRMTQKGCLYDPPVLVANVGSRLIIGNDDTIL